MLSWPAKHRIEAFSIKLDTYETATVEALIANEKAMELVQARLDDLLDRAHVVEDGRRVFKTRDGEHRFLMSLAKKLVET